MANTVHSIPAEHLPQYDELYVISDLHLGGTPGFQIFNGTEELVRLVEHLRTSGQPDQRVGLVVNGDFVDFLAEDPPVYFDPVNAGRKLNRIAKEDDTFRPVFEALRNFAGTKNRFLIINLGNHDLELALPWVREQLLGLLSGGEAEARGRITLDFDGSGYLCRVGNAKVLCVHGNEVDFYNLTDHERIRQIGRNVVQGRPAEPWIPNAGTQLVINVMNGLKSRFPFIDLLKPEVEAVLPTLAALAPEQITALRAVSLVAVQYRRAQDRIRRALDLLGDGKVPAENQYDPYPAASLPPPLIGFVPTNEANKKLAADLLAITEERLHQQEQPMALIDQDLLGEQLGVGGAIVSFFRGSERSEVLRTALDKLRQDRSFDLDYEDKDFQTQDKLIGGDLDYLITGHTHLERALKRKNGRGWYYNSGTWIRLIKLEKEVLESKESFRKVYDAFNEGTMKALDEFPGLVIRQFSVVSIRSDGAKTTGELNRVDLSKGDKWFSPVPRSQFPKT